MTDAEFNKPPFQPTLREYLRIATLANIPKAVEFFNDKAAKSPKGLDEPVLADPDQMIVLIASLK